jgi:hypothetical protein
VADNESYGNSDLSKKKKKEIKRSIKVYECLIYLINLKFRVFLLKWDFFLLLNYLTKQENIFFIART